MNPPNTPFAPRAFAKKPGVAVSRGAGELRLIGGQWKRSKLKILNRSGLRPTPDRVRETLFNWLGQDLSGWTCLDAFAGTGALGFEAASRGATSVLLVEQDAALVQELQRSAQRLHASNLHIRAGDGLQVLEHWAWDKLDLVFLDPPYDAPLYERALVAAARALRPNGWVYLEAAQAWSDEALAVSGLRKRRYLKAGAVHAHLLQPAAESA